jgi:hypothetical protein
VLDADLICMCATSATSRQAAQARDVETILQGLGVSEATR